jgi:nucleotide-binding universal stress UspA family protein
MQRAAPKVYQGLRSLADLAGRDRSDVEILTGDPAAGLALAAEEFGADVICVGKSRRRRGSGRFGATTPQRVLSSTPLPVLVVPENAKAQTATVLAAVNDGSEGAHVLQSASRIARAWNARLDALHVIEPELRAIAQDAIRGANVQITAPRTTAQLTAMTMDALNDARLCLLAREWLEKQTAGLKMRKECVMPIARFGDAGQETIRHAARSDTGLIVVGRCSRPRSTTGVAAIGSTARLTMWVAPCPVLVLGGKSASPQHHDIRSRGDGVPSRRGPSLMAPAALSTNTLRVSSRPGPDGGDAA